MRKLKTLIGVLAVAAVVMGLATVDASANCIPAKVAGNFDANIGLYAPWNAGPGVDEASLSGKFWQQGNFAAGNSGTMEDGGLYFFNGVIYMNANLGAAEVNGCPGVRLETVAQVATLDGGTRFLAATIDEVSGPAFDFQYGNLGTLDLVEQPKIQVTSSSRNGTGGVVLNFNVPAIQGLYGPGAASAVQAVRVLSAAGTADPGRGAAAYTQLTELPTTGGTVAGSVTVDCSNIAVDRFVVTQLVFDQGQVGDLVSRGVRIECDPGLADPNHEFKIIDKPAVRPKRER